jgi:DNA replication and repair protein RecF
VILKHLSLTNFRNFARLELSLQDRLTLFQGANAQGKTNLLEAIHLLATGRSPRAGAERELIAWLALESPLPYARLVAEVGEGGESQKLELVLEPVRNGGGAGGPVVRKQVRVNNTPRRALDLIGRLRVVLFLPEDISLVSGAPSERRRYLDIALCQISHPYCRALAEYNRALAQRNALLRRLRDEGGDAAQLAFWDDQLAEHGSVLLHRRAQAVAHLQRIAEGRHRALAGGRERLRLAYLPGAETGQIPGAPGVAREEIAARLLRRLRDGRGREIAAGSSLVGPHRDDVTFDVDGRDLRCYGSRGQQRTGALALKLAEVEMMREETGDSPLLLLDDVMSELDETRRHALLDALEAVSQALVTTTDWSDFSPDLLSQSRRYRVEAGRIADA